MEKEKLDKEKLISEMKALRDKRIAAIMAINSQRGIDEDELEISRNFTIKYLGKMEFVNETGEMIEKDVFVTVEQIDGQFQIRYYDNDQNLLGIQSAIDSNIMLSTNLSLKSDNEQKRIISELEEKDQNEAKTLEELEEEKQSQEQAKAENNGPQLTQTEVSRLKGPKVELTQKVDGITLAEAIGLDGKQMQLIDVDEARRLMPDLEIPTGQRTIPIEIFANGSADIIGEDKLKYSTIEGVHSTIEHLTMNNEGNWRKEQNIETFNIVKKGEMHTIALSFDEERNNPFYEIKYGIRDKENPTQIVYSELDTVHEGPLKSTAEAEEERHEYTEGETKGIKEVVDKENAIKYAQAKGIYLENSRVLDIEKATEELEELSRGGRSVEEIVQEAEEDEKQPGPQDNRRF